MLCQCSGRRTVQLSTGKPLARARAANWLAPELRWRSDIGDRFLGGERERLRALGWLP